MHNRASNSQQKTKTKIQQETKMLLLSTIASVAASSENQPHPTAITNQQLLTQFLDPEQTKNTSLKEHKQLLFHPTKEKSPPKQQLLSQEAFIRVPFKDVIGILKPSRYFN